MSIFDNYSYILTAIIVLLIGLYSYFTRNFSYWADQGIDGPKPVLWFGTTIYELFGVKSYLEVEWLQKYGKIYGLYKSTVPVLTVAEPELIEKICVNDFDVFTNTGIKRVNDITASTIGTSEGKDWKRLRGIVSPIFSSGNFRQMYPKISKRVNELTDVLRAYAKSRNEVELKVIIYKFVFHVLGDCIYDHNIDTHNDTEFVTEGKKVSRFYLFFEIIKAIMPAWLTKVLCRFSPEEIGNNYFINFGRHLINEKLKNNSEKTAVNLIDMLLKVYSEKGQKETTKKFITEKEVLGQAWVFSAANYLMTGNLLASLIHELSHNEQCQQKLYEELCVAIDGDDIDVELVSKLQYLDAVIAETLRLHAPTMRVFRVAAHSYVLDNTGITIAKGTPIEIPIYGMHLMDEYFPNAQTFIPDRFMPENKHLIMPYTYLPFGCGPRVCMGRRFVLMQTKICLAQLVMKFRFHATKQTARSMNLFRNLLFHGPESVVVGIEERQ